MSQMGQIHPFFESAGFQRVGVIRVESESRETHSRIFGGRRRGAQRLVTQETFLKSRYARARLLHLRQPKKLRSPLANPEPGSRSLRRRPRRITKTRKFRRRACCRPRTKSSR